MWGLFIQSSKSFAMARQSFSNDLYIFSEYDNSEHETFYLGSPHLNSLSEDDSDQAYYRSKALIRMLNGFLMLKGELTFAYDDAICFMGPNDVYKRHAKRRNDFSIEEYEEIFDPFDHDIVLEEKAEKSYLRDCFTIAKENPSIRQTIVFFSLSKLDVLYFLNNTYKIYENILFDLKIAANKDTYKKIRIRFPKEIIRYLDYFILGDFTHYINSEKGSGILSRHGHSKTPYDKAPLDLEEIDFNIRNLINHWLRMKMEERFGYHYSFEYQRKIEESMKDDDYNFDF